jgi:hypothetical protein
VVLLTFKPEVTRQERDIILNELRSLPSRIPAISEYEIGFGMNPGNATLAIVASFADESGFEEYRHDPLHRAIAERLLVPATDSSMVAQFRTDPGAAD